VKKKRSRGVEEADGEQRQEPAKKSKNNPGNLMRFLEHFIFFVLVRFMQVCVCVCVFVPTRVCVVMLQTAASIYCCVSL